MEGWENIFMASVTEQAQRFEDRVDFLLPNIQDKDGDFTPED